MGLGYQFNRVVCNYIIHIALSQTSPHWWCDSLLGQSGVVVEFCLEGRGSDG